MAKRRKKRAKKHAKKRKKTRSKGKVPLKILEKRLVKLNSIVRARSGHHFESSRY